MQLHFHLFVNSRFHSIKVQKQTAPKNPAQRRAGPDQFHSSLKFAPSSKAKSWANLNPLHGATNRRGCAPGLQIAVDDIDTGRVDGAILLLAAGSVPLIGEIRLLRVTERPL
jgi:hypothetical protein